MIKKIFNILILFFFLHHCEYKPIYSDLNKADFKLNIINIEGDSEMNNLVSSRLKKYSKKSSNKVYNLKIQTKYKRENLIRNKRRNTTYLLINEINFYVKIMK